MAVKQKPIDVCNTHVSIEILGFASTKCETTVPLISTLLVLIKDLTLYRSWFLDKLTYVVLVRYFNRTGTWGPFLESPETLQAIFGCHNHGSRVSEEWRGFNSSNFTVIFLFVNLKTC